MRVCTRCGIPRCDESFYADSTFPPDVCKPCVHRPAAARHAVKQRPKDREQRAQAAMRYVVKYAQSRGESLVYLCLGVKRSYKIGFSTDVNKRLRQLATGCSVPVQLIAVAPGGRLLEQDLHREFESRRRAGEWFKDGNHTLARRFATLPGAMVFLPGFIDPESPVPPSPDVNG